MLVRHHLEISGEAALRAAGRRQPDRGRRRTIQQALVALLVNAVEAMKGLKARAN